MNRFLAKVDFQRASVPMNRRVKIYYMTQAAVAPPTFVLFTDKDVKLHFAFERFLANQIREHFNFIGSPIWFKKPAPGNKKKPGRVGCCHCGEYLSNGRRCLAAAFAILLYL